jgi:hypothetical protein
MHRTHLRVCLRNLKKATLYAARYKGLMGLCGSLLRGVLRGCFHRWASTSTGQGVVLGMMRGVYRTLEGKYWVGAAKSVRIRPLGEMGEMLWPDAYYSPSYEYASIPSSPSSSSSFSAKVSGLKPFECPIPPYRVLHTCPPALQLVKAFASWMALFRIRVRHLRYVCMYIC